MKAVDLGQEFVWFSFMIENDKRVVNTSEVYWRLSCFRKQHFFVIFKQKYQPNLDHVEIP